MLTRLKRTLLYAGLTPEQFAKVQPLFFEENNSGIHWYSMIMTVFFAVLGISSAFSDEFSHANVRIYFITAICLCLIFLGSNWEKKQKEVPILFSRVMFYGFLSILYIESIVLTLQHVDMPAVTFIGVLLVIPLLFSDRPRNVIVFQVLYVTVFCIATHFAKNPEIASVDIWNAVSFLFVSIICILILMPLRIRALYQTYEIQFLSEHDVLTGVKNRNSFEMSLDSYRSALPTLFCIYADANGLHELNNREGHKAGDIMLQSIALGMSKEFGSQSTYRIGGDEFISVLTDSTSTEIDNKIQKLASGFQSQGYHIAMGFAGPEDHCETLSDLVTLAETRMFQVKDAYYTANGISHSRNEFAPIDEILQSSSEA